MAVASPPGARRPRVAYLSYSNGAFDARSQRMARSAYQAGFDVTIYARVQAGLPDTEERDGYRIVRTWWHPWLGFPILRTIAFRRLRRPSAVGSKRGSTQAAAASPTSAVAPSAASPEVPTSPAAVAPTPVTATATAGARRPNIVRRVIRRVHREWEMVRQVTSAFPIRPRGWAFALDRVVEPADIWHGMWAGSLPALDRLGRHRGGRTIYDARDIYMESRDFAKARRPVRSVLAGIERRYAGRVDRVLTVNDSYALLLEERLGVARPAVVMNCRERWTPPTPAPDLLREALGLPSTTRIALYQGLLSSERGIDETMDAILQVPDAVLVLLGMGRWERRLRRLVAEPPYVGRVFLLPPVSPDELLAWTASADVSVMAIAPTTLNHRHTTPQKLFESLAAGVPVVASDLPGMAAIVRSAACGELVDPTSPASIAEGIRRVFDAPAPDRVALRSHVLEVAHREYAWETQVTTLLAMYRELLALDGIAMPLARAEDVTQA